ncbi:MAG TPA: MG2 domain-containing protein, partial [Chitinophagales bacterium]|nr:MG2 domain-containing protein [Chitinophagales bacterium]
MFHQLKKTGLLLLILFMTNQHIMAQTNYETLWKSVAKLENDGKTKDAQKAVESIVEKSRKDKNTTQTVKALLYKYKYTMTLEEESELKIVNDLKAEIQKSDGADKAVLQSILGELYFQYFNENTWKFSNRTETDVKQSDDFRTWDLKTLFKEINSYYVASVENKALLQQTKLDNFAPILEQEKGSTVFRPTLYDLLANRAIDYFNNDKSNLSEPSNAFSIDDKKYFGTANDFVSIQLNDADKNAQDYNALKIYQDLLAFRLKDKNNLDALADADLKRIQFVKEHYFNKDDNEALYYEALKRLKTEYSKCNVGAIINYEIANYINQKAQEENTKNKFTVKEALAVCDETIKNYPLSEGAKNCTALKESIFFKNLSLSTEETVVPDGAFKALVSYKNITKIYLKIVPVSYKDKDKIFSINNNETQDDIIKRLNAIKPVRTWNQTLPDSDDYLDHSTEIKIDGIKKGYYAILVSTNPTFTVSTGKEAVAITTLFASQISYVTKNSSNNENFELYVLNRNDGQPLQNATVKFYRNTYDYKQRKYIRTELGSATSDATGYVSKKISKQNTSYYSNENFQVEIFYKDDFLPGEQSYYKYFYPQNETAPSQKQVHLFTDRSIYRPGQTIYVKGIATQRTGDNYKILPNEKVNVIFKDVNYQDIKTQEFTTNEFGSFTGTFTAPTTGLMGSMTLETNFGSVTVQVEEYKRPKFEV